MYYLKLDNVEDMGDGKSLVSVAGMTFMVPADNVTTQQQAPAPDMSALLEHIQGLTSHIQGLGQPSNLSQFVASGTASPVDNSRESEASQPPTELGPSEAELESLGIRSASPDMPFRVNEPRPTIDLGELATKLSALYAEHPDKRRQVIQRIAGMVRGDMLQIKDYLQPELRRAVLGNIMNRDSLKTSVVPPDLAAFVDDRPLHQTLGSRDWDPGSEQAKDHVSSNWRNSETVMNKIASEVDEAEFAHMYPSTGDVASQVNRKFSSANKSEQ